MPAQRPSSPAIVFGIGALALLGVIALFQVVLEPPERIPCSSELAPGTFRETLVPAHLAAAAILFGCLWELGANRRGLAAVAAFALVSLVVPAVFALVGFAAFLAVQMLIYIAIPALLICTSSSCGGCVTPPSAGRPWSPMRASRSGSGSRSRCPRTSPSRG